MRKLVLGLSLLGLIAYFIYPYVQEAIVDDPAQESGVKHAAAPMKSEPPATPLPVVPPAPMPTPVLPTATPTPMPPRRIPSADVPPLVEPKHKSSPHTSMTQKSSHPVEGANDEPAPILVIPPPASTHRR